MAKNNLLKQDNWELFRWGLVGLICVMFVIYVLFLAIAIQYDEDISTIWMALGPAFVLCLPNLLTGILFYFTGFAFRGKERSNLKIFLEEKDDGEKSMLIMAILKTMKEKPLLPFDRIKDINL